jgi:FlaA1/EpsC-like NDP-sugar epimerase
VQGNGGALMIKRAALGQQSVLALSRWLKRLIVLVLDCLLCLWTAWLGFYLRLGEFISFSGDSNWSSGLISAALSSVMLAIPLFSAIGLYRVIFRYGGWPALLAISKAILLYGLIYSSIFTVIGVADVPRTVGIIQPLLLLIFVGASRALANAWLGSEYQRILRHADRPKVLIYGAGQTGRQLAAAMANTPEMQVVGFLDDDDRLQGHVLNGHRIYSPQDLGNLAFTLKVSDVLLAMPSISRKKRNQILDQIRSSHVSVRTLPSVTDLAKGRVSVNDLRELDIDDLLGREPVTPNHTLLAKNVVGKVVLVTGAGGSIGSELCRQILSIGPAKLLMIDQNEFALYQVHHELESWTSRNTIRSAELVPLLASAQDKDRLNGIMSTWCPATVYHAAAYKHVPLVEHNPAEGIKNNVMGTLRTAQAAVENGVADFVLVSTDKAVRPTNIMGASKRLAEQVLQALSQKGGRTKFSIVRFGNVLDSSGSVVPKFRQQIREGGPISLTHPEITRFFMTIPEASQLVIQAGAMAKGGDVFVLDMGEPIRIYDLARRMVELSGLTVKDEHNPDGDIQIQVTGLRPGEKLYEELLIGDNPEATSHPRIMRAREKFLEWNVLEEKLSLLEPALHRNDVGVIRSIMLELVPEYLPASDIVDWTVLERSSYLVRAKKVCSLNIDSGDT